MLESVPVASGDEAGYMPFTHTLMPGSHLKPMDLIDCGRSLARNRTQNLLEMLKMFQSMELSSVRDQIILKSLHYTT